MTAKLFLLISLFLLSGLAFAEGNCPDGMVPIGGGGVVGCMPIEGGQNNAAAQSRGRWVNRWGAIAIDNSVSAGGFGAVINAKNKREATKAAIAQCRINGGGAGCKIKVSYYNQCAVVAWGDSSYVPAWGPDVKETSQRALKSCSAATTNCKIFYADCTRAEWIP